LVEFRVTQNVKDRVDLLIADHVVQY